MPSGGMRTKPGGKCIAHHRTRPQPQISLSHPHSAYNFFIATASAAPTGVGPAQVHPAADRRRWTRPERSVAPGSVARPPRSLTTKYSPLNVPTQAKSEM